MDFIRTLSFSAFGLAAVMFVFIEIGRSWGSKTEASEATRVARSAVEGSVFAMFGLLVAFTFSGAAERFDARRELIVDEANAIGTAYLRVDLLPASGQPEMRDLFRRYLDSRLETYRLLPDVEAAMASVKESEKLQSQIWSSAVAQSQSPEARPSAAIIFLPALNQMIDIATTRLMVSRTHPPKVVTGMLFGLALICSLMVGIDMGGTKRSWIHIAGFVLITAGSLFVILDMEYPRLGFIRVDAHDQVLQDLRDKMK